jgi:threonine/homoserine efflux transporter RhtA
MEGKMNAFSKKIVALVIMLNVAFTGVVLYLFLITGSEPTTLIGCWFGFTTIELWALSGITKTKITQGGGDEQWRQ